VTIRVLIADDEELVRAGLRMLLETDPEISVVGESFDGFSAVEDAVRLHPDVVLMDIRMPRMDGLEATGLIVSRADRPPRVVVLTTVRNDEYVYQALRAGATGFLLKDSPRTELTRAVRVVAEGEGMLHPAASRALIEEFARLSAESPPWRNALADLSDREVEVMRWVARGLSNQEIATALHVSRATVKTHVASILDKVGVRDRTQLAVLAYESGLVERGGNLVE
jgi:DNA-binding NarL/FixJ family response regulator